MTGLIYQLFDVMHSHNFDTQADGFETLKEVLDKLLGLGREELSRLMVVLKGFNPVARP